MAYFQAQYETLVNGVVTATETVTVYGQYSDMLSCQQEEAAVNALGEEAIKALRAQCTTAAPAAPEGKHVQARDCSGGDPIIPLGDNSNYVAPDGTTPVVPTDPGTPNANYNSKGQLLGYVIS